MSVRRVVYPGTFDPIHFGHVDIAQRAADIFDELVVGVYDHGRPSKSLLFSVEERVAMVEAALNGRPNIRVVAFSGLLVEFARLVGARLVVRGLRVFSDFEFEFRMALANQRLAPEIDVVVLLAREEHTFLSSTIVREIASFGGDVGAMVPAHVVEALRRRFSQGGQEYSSPVPLRD